MNAVWRILTLPCEEAARIMSDGMDRALTNVERIALRAHLISCRSCKRFRKQLMVIDAAAKAAADEKMPDDSRERIRANIDNEQG